MNANTILAFRSGTGRNQLAAQAVASTTARAATVNTDNGVGATAVLSVPLQSAILGAFNPLSPNENSAILGPAYGRLFGTPRGGQTPYFSSTSFDGVPFRVRISGTGVAGANAAQSVLASLTLGTSSVIGSNVLIATSGAALAAVAGGAFAWTVVAECLWTLGSGANGNLASRHSATITFLPTPTIQVVSDVIQSTVAAPALTVAALSFVPFITFGNAAASTAQFTEFSLELI